MFPILVSNCNFFLPGEIFGQLADKNGLKNRMFFTFLQEKKRKLQTQYEIKLPLYSAIFRAAENPSIDSQVAANLVMSFYCL
ncbi:MAG: hypothetical protein DWQ05_17595 [Calditrichaeota bacterium]|nr:MAG: hypothetical protein DWQ05_17595 [Calditrichota bacterium]